MSILDGTTGWCPDHAVCVDWIERRALQCVENFQDVDSVYMSTDIYTQFLKTATSQMLYIPGNQAVSPVQNIAYIHTSAGPLTVKQIPFMTNFCYVGTHVTYDDLVRVKVDKEFEEIVLKDCEVAD